MGVEANISCKGVWKLFGPDPVGFFKKHHGDPSVEAIFDGGYITAVRDVAPDVYPGEILVVIP